jgi:dTDP-glucose 4,6-dehydratase
LNGDDIHLGSLHPTRDLTYVSDTVAGFLLAAATTEAIGKTVNLGNGQEIAIGELAQLIARLTERSIAIHDEERRIRPQASEVERLLSDNKLARSLLGWEPVVSLEEGLKRTIDWIQENQERYRSGEYTL